jgi:hypothetical protein
VGYFQHMNNKHTISTKLWVALALIAGSLDFYLCLAFLCTSAHGLNVSNDRVVYYRTLGVNKSEDCPYLAQIRADIASTGFPAGWTVYVACTPQSWDLVLRQADSVGRTHTGFTNRKNRITVINGAMYYSGFSQFGTLKSGASVLRHELGHIICNCSDENEADRAVGF